MTTTSSLFPVLPQHPILLVCTSASVSQRPEIDQLVITLRALIKPVVQVIRIDEATHPEVVRSFGFTIFPAFTLLQQGFELWRYTGPIDAPILSTQLNHPFARYSSTK